MKIDVNQLANNIMGAMEAYGKATDEQVRESIIEVAQKATEITRSAGDYKDRTGKYRKSITHDKLKTDKTHQYHVTIYVKGQEYRLTHLLEFGHQTRKGGRTTKPNKQTDVKAYPHFAKGEQYAEDQLVTTIKRKIEGGL